MKRKYKLKKSAIIIISIILISIIVLIVFLLSIIKTKSYSIEYNIDDYKISEYFDDKINLFYFEIKKEDITYNFVYPSKYIKERKLIKEISSYNKDDETCLIVNSEYISTNPLCNINNELVDYRLVSSSLLDKLNYTLPEEERKENTIYNYTIYNNDLNIYIWNYKGFNHINNNELNNINLFNKDIYDIPLAAKINNYLVIPDYEQEYTFNKVYLLDLETDKLDTWTLKYNISYESYVLGINNKSLFIIDKKNKREYELVPHKKKMRIIANSDKQGIIYNNGEEKKMSINTLTSENYSFTYKHNYNYKIIDNKLYLSYLDKGKFIKISNNNITSIIYTNEDTIYYLVDTTLYKYNIKDGEQKLISYSEWEYNNNNVIFINNEN